jgi:hypothetical protein
MSEQCKVLELAARDGQMETIDSASASISAQYEIIDARLNAMLG